MAKKIDSTTEQAPCIQEDGKPVAWYKTKRAQLIALVTGGVLLLGASFGVGVAVGDHRDRPGDFQQFNGFGDDDHRRPPHGPGDRDGQFDPNQQPGQAPSGAPTTSQNG